MLIIQIKTLNINIMKIETCNLQLDSSTLQLQTYRIELIFDILFAAL